MATSRFSLKTMKQIKPLSFFIIILNWHSNACYIYWQVVLLGWFLNTFEIVFTQKIQRVDSFICFNFVLTSHMVTFSPWIARVFKVAHLLALTKPLDGICLIRMGETLCELTSCVLWLQLCVTFSWHISICTNSKL
jgi:hypothetical protein